MTTFNYNSELIKAMKEKIPSGVYLANTLIDMLYLGKEAVYRRLRGEVPFTLAEAAIISQKMGVSLDKLVGTNMNANAIFDLNIVRQHDPLETYYSIVNNYVRIFREIKDDPMSELCTSSNMIPQTFYLKYELLSKFRMFKWLYQYSDVDTMKPFRDVGSCDRVKKIQREFLREVREIRSCYFIFDHLVFRYLVTDILFFVSINLITPEELKVLQAELLELLEGMERFVAKGCYDDTGNEIYVYLSNINLDTSYCYLGGQNYHLSMLKAFTLNSITSFDVETFHRLKNWMSSLKRSSTLISVSGEKERVRFFNDQRCLVQEMTDTI